LVEFENPENSKYPKQTEQQNELWMLNQMAKQSNEAHNDEQAIENQPHPFFNEGSIFFEI
jgi:hypothetical protein